MPVTGQIFDVQRFSIHDGPGIRTTVFLKGCPLNCLWCHNPEGLRSSKQLSFLASKCIGCGWCVKACPSGAHVMVSNKHNIDREVCIVCGKCTEECHAKALELIGRSVTVEEVIAEVLRDKPFYETSGGGMTLSGGEPLQQVDFTDALLTAAKENGLHCAIQTCGHAAWERYERIFPKLDTVMFDIKETDPARHRSYTGVDNTLILANLRKLHDSGARILVRLPIVPGLNDRREHFQAVAELTASLPNLLGLEVMPYHRLGLGKTERFGLGSPPQELLETESPGPDEVRGWIKTLVDFGANVINDQATG